MGYKNTELFNYISNYFGIQQIPYSNSQTARIKKDVLELVDNFTEKLPEYFIKLLNEQVKDTELFKQTCENLYIAKVNTTHSLCHSILHIFNEDYRTSNWERREYLVGLFK